MIQQILTKEIEYHVAVLFQEYKIEQTVTLKILIEHPAHLDHGDYSTNAAMLLAKIVRKAPLQIAQELQQRIEKSGSIQGLFAKVAAVPPGFLNFYINWGTWSSGHYRAKRGLIVLATFVGRPTRR
ncbi:hypothetical protein AB4Z22_10895 [Paenibacillus sp. TAF58]